MLEARETFITEDDMGEGWDEPINDRENELDRKIRLLERKLEKERSRSALNQTKRCIR